MVFVTVGTHEQQFNRLVEAVDRLKASGALQDDIVVQTGFSTYEPKHCRWEKLMPYHRMDSYIREARIVITHGGPASFIAPLQIGKIPIVVPRRKKYGEHVNDHQAEFCRAVEERMGNILLVEDIRELPDAVEKYDLVCGQRQSGMAGHNQLFNEKLDAIIQELGL